MRGQNYINVININNILDDEKTLCMLFKNDIITFDGNDKNRNINILPYTIKKLYLDGYNANGIINNLPRELILLNFCVYIFNIDIKNLPISLKFLHIHASILSRLDRLNPSMIKLSLNIINNKFGNINFPNNLRVLKLNIKSNICLDFLPESLEILKIHRINNKINDLPMSIREIWIKKEYKEFINEIYKNKFRIV